MVGSTLDINQVFERVTTETHKLIPFDRFLVNLKKTPDGQFISAYVSGIDNPMRRVGDLYPSQGSATGVVMNTRTGILIQPTEAGEIKDLYPNLYETFKTGLHSTMSVPLISMDEVIGSMNFRSKKLKAYTEQDLRLAERIGMQIAGAIANAQLFDDLSKTEKSLRESELKYRSLIECSSDAIFCVDEKGQYTFTNHVFASTLGKSPDYFIGKTCWDVYPKEHADYRYETTKRVFQTGESESSEVEVPLPSKTLYFYATSNPIKDETGKVILILTHTTDITDRKKAEKKLQDTLESLRKAVGATIQVMVSAVETRDTYTSGHQIRSADLARAIAMEMGLPQDKIDAIRMAGSIHDIGKLSIPAEILSKPTKLSELEFSLIKEHARQGYEMLKNVESPWPLAEIVYQHHERIDGSGYPRNLKGEEICMGHAFSLLPTWWKPWPHTGPIVLAWALMQL